jgi:hypothetical protein
MTSDQKLSSIAPTRLGFGHARLAATATFGLLLALAGSETASAQMFGSGRALGAETINRNVRPGATNNNASGMLGNPNLDPGQLMSTGIMNPGARFIRGNRGSTDFVGRDFGETRDFIGRGGEMQVGNLRSAIDQLIQRADSDTNRQQPNSGARKESVYPPRLQLGFDFNRSAASSQVTDSVVRRMEQRLGDSLSDPFEVTVAGRTAILRGAVASAHERSLAAALASLEPGIDAVQNDLVVVEERDSGPPRPAANALPADEVDPLLPAAAFPPRSESLAPRSSPAARRPVVQPVAP